MKSCVLLVAAWSALLSGSVELVVDVRTLGSATFFREAWARTQAGCRRSPPSQLRLHRLFRVSNLTSQKRTARFASHVQNHLSAPKHAASPAALTQTGGQGILQGQRRRLPGHNRPLRQLLARLEQDTHLCVPSPWHNKFGGTKHVAGSGEAH